MDSINTVKNTILLWLRKEMGRFQSALWKNRWIRKILLPHVHEPKNKELKDIFIGRRAFIIGNGSSILKQDLIKLKGEVVFVLNDFFLHPQFHKIRPTFLCSCDPGFNDVEFRKRWYKLHEKIDTKKTTMLFNKRVKRTDVKHELFQNHKVYYLHPASMLVPPLWEMKHAPTDITLPLSGHNLAFIDIALFAAHYMGIKKIYLLGMDWGEIKSFKDYVNYDFYGKHPLISLRRYRRDYDFYYKNQAYRNSRIGYHEKTIACLKRTFAKKGMKIYNATYNKGNFKGFRHVDFEGVIKSKS